jgi:hypothetical protein
MGRGKQMMKMNRVERNIGKVFIMLEILVIAIIYFAALRDAQASMMIKSNIIPPVGPSSTGSGIHLLLLAPSAAAAVQQTAPEASPEERELLERVVAAEARGEPYEGMVAVALTAVNRALEWDMTIEAVLTEPRQYAAPYRGEVSVEVREAVSAALAGEAVFDGDPTHFHEASVRPYWAGVFVELGQVGNHVFYAGWR